MTFIRSRLMRELGWNRSASIGQAVWGGTNIERARSEPSTASGSPADSDDEEYEADVDYDDVRLVPSLRISVLMKVSKVLAIIDRRGANPGGSPRGKRRTGRSYRDLTTLEWTPASLNGHGMEELPVEESVEKSRTGKVTEDEEGKIALNSVSNGRVQARDSRVKRE